jgi:hypothetical protein
MTHNGALQELISPTELLLYGYKFKLASGMMQESLVSVFPGKIVQGDATRADDPLASSFVMSDWTGGLLKQKMDPAVDFDRFWLSTGATWFTRQLTLGPAVRFKSPPSQGDQVQRHIRAGVEFRNVQYFAWETFFCKLEMDESVSILFEVPGVIADMAVYRIMAGANAGKSWVVIAYTTGSGSGYWVFKDDLTWAAGVGGEGAIAFTIWDDKLIKLDTTGNIRYTLDLITWQDLLGGVVTLPQNSAFTLALYPNGFGDDAIHVGTKEGLYFYDDSMARIRRTKLMLPRLKDQGTTMVNHQDNLFFSGGSTQILRYTGATVDPASGLNQDDGLPQAYRGTVRYLHSSLNFLMAVVDSQIDTPLGDPIFTGDELSMATVFYGSVGFAFLAGQTHIGGGWHMLYSSETVGTGARWAGTSTADDKYRIFFGLDGQLVIMDAHPDILNPLQNPVQEFRPNWDHVTPWNDHGWSELDKLAIAQEFGVERLQEDCACTIIVSYGLDYGQAWYPLCTIDDNTPPKIRYGADQLGIAYRAIRFRFQGYRCPITTHSPVLKFSTLIFLKQLPPRYGYRMDIDCTGRYAGLEPEEQISILKDLADPGGRGAMMGEMVAWVDGMFTTKAVKIVTLTNSLGSGPTTSGMVKLSVVEPVEPT